MYIVKTSIGCFHRSCENILVFSVLWNSFVCRLRLFLHSQQTMVPQEDNSGHFRLTTASYPSSKSKTHTQFQLHLSKTFSAYAALCMSRVRFQLCISNSKITLNCANTFPRHPHPILPPSLSRRWPSISQVPLPQKKRLCSLHRNSNCITTAHLVTQIIFLFEFTVCITVSLYYTRYHVSLPKSCIPKCPFYFVFGSLNLRYHIQSKLSHILDKVKLTFLSISETSHHRLFIQSAVQTKSLTISLVFLLLV